MRWLLVIVSLFRKCLLKYVEEFLDPECLSLSFGESPHTWAHSQNSGICFLKANLGCFPEILSASGPYFCFDQAPGVV